MIFYIESMVVEIFAGPKFGHGPNGIFILQVQISLKKWAHKRALLSASKVPSQLHNDKMVEFKFDFAWLRNWAASLVACGELLMSVSH